MRPDVDGAEHARGRRAKEQNTITVTHNDIRQAPPKDKFVLAVVVIDSHPADSVNDIPMPVPQEPNWAEAIKNRDNQLHAPRPNHPEKLPLL